MSMTICCFVGAKIMEDARIDGNLLSVSLICFRPLPNHGTDRREHIVIGFALHEGGWGREGILGQESLDSCRGGDFALVGRLAPVGTLWSGGVSCSSGETLFWWGDLLQLGDIVLAGLLCPVGRLG